MHQPTEYETTSMVGVWGMCGGVWVCVGVCGVLGGVCVCVCAWFERDVYVLGCVKSVYVYSLF